MKTQRDYLQPEACSLQPAASALGPPAASSLRSPAWVFGGRLLFTLNQGSIGAGYMKVTRVFSDRLGSTRATETIEQYGGGWTTRNYYPFGEEITSTSNDQYKFASTYRDSATGLDYAVNRYYASGTGRFLTTDPYRASGGPANPGSWNRYAYVGGDPVNFRDPRGLLEAPPDGGCSAEFSDCGEWNWIAGDGGGGGVRSGGAPAPPPPLSCKITRWRWDPRQAGLQTIGNSTGYVQPVALTVQAQGGNGNGSYSYSSTQVASGTGSAQTTSGSTIDLTLFQLEELDPDEQGGSQATFEDNPGVAAVSDAGNPVVAFSIQRTYTLNVWVQSGNQLVNCGTFTWTQTMSMVWPGIIYSNITPTPFGN